MRERYTWMDLVANIMFIVVIFIFVFSGVLNEPASSTPEKNLTGAVQK